MLCGRMLLGFVSLLGFAGTAAAQEKSEIWHYWGSGAEHDAIQSVIDLSNKLHPDTPIEGRLIVGNAIELRRQLQNALLGGTAPAAYQSAMGYELKLFADAGQLRPIDTIWSDVDAKEIFPQGLQRVMKVDGTPYAIPLNMHVISNIFYNKKLFDEMKLEPPKSFEELQALCVKIEAAGKACLADAGGPFWSLYNFYGSLVSVLGVDGYFKLASGGVPFDGPEFQKALTTFRDTYIKHYIKDWGGKTWPQGADDVVAGRAVLYQMGDWVSGYFKDVKWVPGQDYDFFPAPGFGSAVEIQVDAIASPKGTNASDAAADNFMKVAASTDGQAGFNIHKGSIAANVKTSPGIYDYIGKKTYSEVQAAGGAVLPNLFFLLPTELGSELGVQIEKFAGDPSDATLNSVTKTLEGLRQDAIAKKAFVTW